MDRLPAIPPITDPDLLHAVSSLTVAADSFRSAFLTLLSKAKKTPEIEKMLIEQEPYLTSCEDVVNHWIKQLDLEDKL